MSMQMKFFDTRVLLRTFLGLSCSMTLHACGVSNWMVESGAGDCGQFVDSGVKIFVTDSLVTRVVGFNSSGKVHVLVERDTAALDYGLNRGNVAGGSEPIDSSLAEFEPFLKQGMGVATPVSASSNGIVAAIHPLIGPDRLLRKSLVLINRNEPRRVVTIDLEGLLGSIAWNPEGTRFAVTYRVDSRRSESSATALSRASVHGTPVYDLWLAMLDLDGRSLCKARIAAQVPYAAGYVEWLR